MNATAKLAAKSVPNRLSVGSVMVMTSAGKKIRRVVAIASPMANARIIHSLCNDTLPARIWTKPLTRATRNTMPKRPMTTLSGQPPFGITSPINKAVTPTATPMATSSLPAQRW
jgi:hypothetical protein